MRNTIYAALFFSFFSTIALAEPIKVGAILPLTGDVGTVGTEIQRGIELGKADHPNLDLRIRYEDDLSMDKAASVKAANKLVNFEKVDLLFSGAINTVKSLQSVVKKSNIPIVVIWDNNESINQLGETVYAIGYSTELAGEDMAEYAYKSLQVRNVAVISAIDEWSEVISEAFQKKFIALGGEVSTRERVSDKESDFKSLLTKVKDKEAEAIYAPLFPSPTVSIIQQSRQLQFKGYLLTADGFGENEAKLLGKDGENVYVTQTWAQNQSLIEKYRAKYGQQTSPTNLAFVALGYDAVGVINEAVKLLQKEAKKPTRETLQATLPKVRFHGFSGENVLDSSLHQLKREPILRVSDGNLMGLP